MDGASGCQDRATDARESFTERQEPCKHRVYCVALDLSAEFGILRQNEPMWWSPKVVSLVLYTLAQAPERVASLGVTAP